ncbi:MAG: prepilin-type N-terminal cleavage/methylation domain-containing protein [Actinomycetota bacterium]|nr:prepilin-type N-terminal cleavage/methylation domain-containing protein [Actinomycetota bacterium]
MHQAINKLRDRRRDGEGGFTLIELMVVVLIIAILLAIAIPTFLGARKRAQDRAAQSSLRNSLTSAKTIFTDSQSYADADVAALNAAEPTITHVATASTGAKMVSVDATTGAGTAWYGAVKSEGGTCFYIQETTTAGTKFGKDPAAASCAATAIAPPGGYVEKW